MDRMNMKTEERSKLAKSNMSKVLKEKYGKNWEKIMMWEKVTPDML